MAKFAKRKIGKKKLKKIPFKKWLGFLGRHRTEDLMKEIR